MHPTNCYHCKKALMWSTTSTSAETVGLSECCNNAYICRKERKMPILAYCLLAVAVFVFLPKFE